jgi:hypothetical protein
MDQRAFYEIRIRGQLDPSWSERLGGLTIMVQAASTETVFSGHIIDKSALISILTGYLVHPPGNER